MSDAPYMIPHLQIYDDKSNKFSHDFYFRVEEDIKKSKFITTLGRSDNRESAKLFIDTIRKEFPDATHNCWAFALGEPKDTANIGQSDDGEPHGTAGKPMLNILLHSDLGECVVVVTRYFGGIKLGPGGLIRAYQGGVAHALDLVEKIEKIIYEDIIVQCEYEHINKIHHLSPQFNASIIKETFTSQIQYVLRLPQNQVEMFKATLANTGNGKITFLDTMSTLL